MTKKQHPKALTSAEVNALLEQLNHPRDFLIVYLMLYIGLRVSEVTNLLLTDFDLSNRVVSSIGKGNKPFDMPIPDQLLAAINKALNVRPVNASEYLIYNLREPTKPITRHAIYKLVLVAGKKAGIKDKVTPHRLRHTFGTEFFKESGDIGATRVALRHSRLTTTQIYTHTTPQDHRDAFEKLDRRPAILKWFSRLRPLNIHLFKRTTNVTFGRTVGREKEITQLRKSLRSKAHTALVGERGCGRKHLIGILGLDHIYRVETLSPLRETFVGLCQQCNEAGILEELPTGRSAKPFLDALITCGKNFDGILVVERFDDITKQEVTALRKFAQSWTLCVVADRKSKPKLEALFFGGYVMLECKNLDRNAAFELINAASDDLAISDRKAFCAHLYSESQGNPQAILDMVDMTRRDNDVSPTHSGMRKVLSATPFITMFSMLLIAMRYSANALSAPSLKIYVVIFVCCLVPLMLMDRILRLATR